MKKTYYYAIAFVIVLLILVGILIVVNGKGKAAVDQQPATPDESQNTVSPNAKTRIAIAPQSPTATVGSELTFTISIDSENNVSGTSVFLTFDPNVLEITSVTPGSFLTTVLQNTINPKGGVAFSAGTIKGKTGAGTIAVVHAKALAKTSNQTPLLHIEERSVVTELHNQQSVLQTTTDAYVTIN